MSSSRKRLRPLDPAEERSVTTSSWVRLAYLDDERSYCLSWPDSPLTRLLSSSTGYAAAHIYHSHTETELSARLSLSNSSTAAGRKPVPVPPVYRISRLQSSSTGTGSGGPHSVAHLLYGVANDNPIVTEPGQSSEAHPLAPPRPLTTREDSILSLTATQVQDVTEAGLLSSLCANGSTTSKEDTARRRRLEWHVTGLEWRAFHESQRTGAALQRLLTLDAAVPPLPSTSADPATSADDERDRELVYELWLRWRLHSAGHVTQQEKDQYAAAGRPAPAPVGSSLPECAWGTPLLCGAYLYGMQNDYFLNPVVAPGTAALQQQQQQQHGGTLLPTGEGGLPGHAGVEGDGSGSFLTRRRGCYNFLRWRIERYLPRLRLVGTTTGAATATSEARGETSSATDDACFGMRHNNVPLGAPQIDALVRRVVLEDPVVDVEMDDAKDTLQSLAWTDLVEECHSWSTWLSKV